MADKLDKDTEVCVVTGGRGFLAKHLVDRLILSDRWIVRILDLAPQIRLSDEELVSPLGKALLSGQVQYVSADLRNKTQVFNGIEGASVVFHMAAPDSSINDFKLHYAVSVNGTRNVIDACIHFGVKKLVYTSSPSTVFDGVNPIVNGEETMPYADKHIDHYSETKAQAEALVLKANGKGGLVTCAIRPSGIFGPGDRLMVPAVVEAARSGKLKFIIGDGQNMFDWTYVENVAYAHICAEEALIPGVAEGDAVAAGKAYFITNCEPRKFWDFLSEILEGLGYPRPSYRIPASIVLPIATAVEWLCQQLAPLGVPMTQFRPARIRHMSVTRTFSCSRAAHYLKYTPQYPLEEGIKQTINSFSYLRADAQPRKNRGELSKTHATFGGGRVADILLWRHERESFLVLIAIFNVYYYFFHCGYTVITALARAALLMLVFLFTYNRLPERIFGLHLWRLPSLSFEVSQEMVLKIVDPVRKIWNGCLHSMTSAVNNKDWLLCLKVLSILFVLRFLGNYPFQALVGIGILCIFILPCMVEKKEEEIEEYTRAAAVAAIHYKDMVMQKLQTTKKTG